MLGLAKSLLIIIFIIGTIAYTTLFSSTIKNFWATKAVINGKSVLGIAVSSPSASASFFKQETNYSLHNITAQISQIKIGEIAGYINTVGKLIHNLSTWEKTAQTDLQQISGQKKINGLAG